MNSDEFHWSQCDVAGNMVNDHTSAAARKNRNHQKDKKQRDLPIISNNYFRRQWCNVMYFSILVFLVAFHFSIFFWVAKVKIICLMNARWRTGHNQHQKNDSCRPKMADSVGAESPYIHRQKTLDLWISMEYEYTIISENIEYIWMPSSKPTYGRSTICRSFRNGKRMDFGKWWILSLKMRTRKTPTIMSSKQILYHIFRDIHIVLEYCTESRTFYGPLSQNWIVWFQKYQKHPVGRKTTPAVVSVLKTMSFSP